MAGEAVAVAAPIVAPPAAAPVVPNPGTSAPTAETAKAPATRGPDGKFTKAEAAAVEAAAAEAERKFKLKVDGAEEEVGEAEVITRAQKSKFFEQQAGKLARELDLSKRDADMVKQMFARAATSDESTEQILAQVLQQRGMTPEQFYLSQMDKLVAKKMADEEYEKLPEETKELRRLREAEAKRVAEEKTKSEKAEADAKSAKTQQVADSIERGIKFGLEGSNLEGNPAAERAMFEYVRQATALVKAGKLEKIPHPKELAAMVEDDLAKLTGNIITKGDRSRWGKFLTPDVIKALTAVQESEPARVHPALKPNRRAPKPEAEAKDPRKRDRSGYVDNPQDLWRALAVKRKPAFGLK